MLSAQLVEHFVNSLQAVSAYGNDEDYTREKLPCGVRLRVRRDLLTEICGCHRKVLCRCIYRLS